MPFQPPLNRPRPIPPQPQQQPMMNTGWRNAYQPFIQEQPKPNLPGFYISSPQDILPRDVPMDGSISFFPSNDLSYIIIKQWTGNGTLADAKYVLEQSVAPQNQANQETAQVQSPQENESEPSKTDETNGSSSEIVEVISAALNEQTQRLTAAFSQIGLAFNTLQKNLEDFSNNIGGKIDSIGNSKDTSQSLMQAPLIPEDLTLKQKTPRTKKEPGDHEKT